MGDHHHYRRPIYEEKETPIILQIGEQNENFDRLYVYIDNMQDDVERLRTVDVSTQASASAGLDTIYNTINDASLNRGRLGAYDNRLQHAINVNRTTTENLTEAESLIRDTDVAEEMMKYTKNNILLQTSQSILSHAMMLPEGVLQLLG